MDVVYNHMGEGDAHTQMLSLKGIDGAYYYVHNQNDKSEYFSNEGVCSWYDFAREIMILSGLECRVEPIESAQYPTKAKRPFYSVLNKSKIKSLGIKVPHWQESLEKCLKKF